MRVRREEREEHILELCASGFGASESDSVEKWSPQVQLMDPVRTG